MLKSTKKKLKLNNNKFWSKVAKRKPIKAPELNATTLDFSLKVFCDLPKSARL